MRSGSRRPFSLFSDCVFVDVELACACEGGSIMKMTLERFKKMSRRDQQRYRMGYGYDREQLRVDARYLGLVNGFKVPIVLIECENDCKKSHEEVAKLMSTSVPLRVLITWAQWNEKYYPKDTRRDECNGKWESVIKSFAGVLQSYGMPLRGVLGFLVGECDRDNFLRYYYFHCDLSKLHADEMFSDEGEAAIGLAPSSPRADSVSLTPKATGERARSFVAQCRHSGQFISFQELERRATACADEGDLLVHAGLFHSFRAVAAADDRDRALISSHGFGDFECAL